MTEQRRFSQDGFQTNKIKPHWQASKSQPSHLHSNDSRNEEEHPHEQTDVGQRFDGLNEGPQQDADGVALTQKFDQTGRPEEAEESKIEKGRVL